MPEGTPKTERERKADHEARFGSSELPPRGAGLTIHNSPPIKINEELAEYLSNLETIRVSRMTPFNEKNEATLSNATAENLDLPKFKPNKLYVLTMVNAVDETTACTRTELYHVIAGYEFALNRDVQSAAGVSVDWSGQVIAPEGSFIRAKFVGGTTSDKLKVNSSGYYIKP